MHVQVGEKPIKILLTLDVASIKIKKTAVFRELDCAWSSGNRSPARCNFTRRALHRRIKFDLIDSSEAFQPPVTDRCLSVKLTVCVFKKK